MITIVIMVLLLLFILHFCSFFGHSNKELLQKLVINPYILRTILVNIRLQICTFLLVGCLDYCQCFEIHQKLGR
jgi:hypothetical protein